VLQGDEVATLCKLWVFEEVGHALDNGCGHSDGDEAGLELAVLEAFSPGPQVVIDLALYGQAFTEGVKSWIAEGVEGCDRSECTPLRRRLHRDGDVAFWPGSRVDPVGTGV
jgi:hypothetical protein